MTGPVVLALDHGRADQEAAVAPGHDVERMARMQEAHGARRA